MAVVLQLSGLKPKDVPIWHDGDVEGDIILDMNGTIRLFAGTRPGPRTFTVQVPAPGIDPFTVYTLQYGSVQPNPPEPPDTNPFQPSPAYRPTLEPVAKAEKTSRQYADKVSAMYGQLAKDVSGGLGSTYQEVADAVADRGAQLGMVPNQYPKLKAAMIASSKALPWSRPDPDAAIADRVEVAACLETIAWAVWEAGE